MSLVAPLLILAAAACLLAGYTILKTGLLHPSPRLLLAPLTGVAALASQLATLWVVQHVVLRHPGSSTPLALLRAVLFGGLPEEGFKLLAVLAVLHFTLPRRWRDVVGISAGVALGFGFAEALLYTYRYPNPLAWAPIRASTALPMHVAQGLIMGALVAGRAGRRYRFLLALATPTLLHGLYDLPAILDSAVPGWLQGLMALAGSGLIAAIAISLGGKGASRFPRPSWWLGIVFLLSALWPIIIPSAASALFAPAPVPIALAIVTIAVMPALFGLDLLRIAACGRESLRPR